MSRATRWANVPFVLCCSALSLGCVGDGIVSSVGVDELRRSVVGDAAKGLDANDRFVLRKESAGEIDGKHAIALAVAFWHDARRYVIGTVSADRGAQVHGEELTPCGRAYYAASAYQSTEAASSTALKKAKGSHWLVGLCYHGVQEVVVAVSAQAQDVEVLQASANALSHPGRSNFFAMGVPVGAEIPISPEKAVTVAAERTGERISAVPRLRMRPFPSSPLLAVWELRIEREVEVQLTKTHRTTVANLLYSGPLNGWRDLAFAISVPDMSADAMATERPATSAASGPPTVGSGLSEAPVALQLATFGGR